MEKAISHTIKLQLPNIMLAHLVLLFSSVNPFLRSLLFSSPCFHTKSFKSWFSASYPKHQGLPFRAYTQAHCMAHPIFLLSKTMLLAELTGPLAQLIPVGSSDVIHTPVV